MKEYAFYIGLAEKSGEGKYKVPEKISKVSTVLLDEKRIADKSDAYGIVFGHILNSFNESKS
jgi:hypothetical protein